MDDELDIMDDNRAPHASPGNGEADPAGTFSFAAPKPLGLSEVVSRLRLHGLTIDSADEALAMDVLRSIGHYRFRGFLAAFEKDGCVRSDVMFSDVVESAQLDGQIRSILLDAISMVEVAFRAELSQSLAEGYGAFALHDRSVFRVEAFYASLQRALERELEQGRQYQFPFIESNLAKYGRLPVWAEMELASLGTASKIFRNLANGRLSADIAKRFRLRPDVLSNWLRYITQVRNMCAHQNRLYGCRFVFTPRLFREHASVDKHRLFPIFIVLFHLMDGVNERKANAFRQRLDGIMRAHPHVDLRPLGFPRNWRELLGLLGPAGQRAPRQRGKNGGRPSVDAQALAEALHLYDMKQLTVAQIAQRTGISQPTIYKYVRKRKEEEDARTEYAVVPL